MKITTLFALLSFLILPISVTAQKFELGKVSIAELEEKAHPLDPSAAAAVLFSKGEVKYEYSQSEGFERMTSVKVRIKIYSKDGYKWANTFVRFYSSPSHKQNLEFSDVVTYNLVDGKIVKTKLKKDGEFDEKINKYWKAKKIAMPDVKEGSVIEYEYRIKSPGVGSYNDWAFQRSIPVNYSEYVTMIPEYYVYKTNFKGSITPKMRQERFPKVVMLNTSERGFGVASSLQEHRFEYQEHRTTYIAENLPAMKAEAYVNNIENYMSSISHELSMTQFPNRPIKSYATDWESVVKTISRNEDFSDELAKTDYFEADINKVIAGLKTREEIIDAIFKHVKNTVNWNDDYQYFCNDGVKAAYKNKTGNVAEINLMLIAMLRHADINANPVLISTRKNGIAYFPSAVAFDYVIAAVETPDGLIYLDATDKYALPNILPLRDLNWFGRMIRKDGSSTEVDLMPKTPSREIHFLNATLKADGTIEGKIRNQLTGHKALAFRQDKLQLSTDAYQEELENENNAIEISAYSRDSDTDLSKPIVETFSFKDTKNCETIANKIYFSPLLFLKNNENPFKQEKREYPVDFGYPSESKCTISIDIPAGYTVESMPQPANLTIETLGSFKYLISNAGNKIQLTMTMNINEAIVPTDYYEALKDFYQKMIEKENEKIVLVKS